MKSPQEEVREILNKTTSRKIYGRAHPLVVALALALKQREDETIESIIKLAESRPCCTIGIDHHTISLEDFIEAIRQLKEPK